MAFLSIKEKRRGMPEGASVIMVRTPELGILLNIFSIPNLHFQLDSLLFGTDEIVLDGDIR